MKVPGFNLTDQFGKQFTNKDLLGQWSLIYFYPKDGTPLCIKEACGFRDGHAELEKVGLHVIGISSDSPESHANFAKENKLEFNLLTDVNNIALKSFGSVDVNEYLGVSRDSYLINPSGEIVKKYTKINPDNHYDEIIKDFIEITS